MTVTGDRARYRYISTIGSGGMARVDLAQDTLLDREVALKRLSGSADARGLRLRREALAGASLSHPNLVAIYDVTTDDDDHLVIVMEYVAGGTLRDELDRRGRLPVREALRILEGIAAGLEAIHERGIVHRDVKPSNVLLGEGGTVKVADLGIASVPDRTRITTSGSVLGSLSYMAPEQLDNTPSTPAVDVYALATVAYELLSGEKARRETNPVTLAHAIATQSPPDLRRAWPEAPAAAADLLARAMGRDPSERPGSPGEFVRRLRTALEPEPTAPVARPPRAVPARTRPPAAAAPEPPAADRAHRRGLVAGTLVALVAAGVAVAAILSSGSSPRPGTSSSSSPTSTTRRAAAAAPPGRHSTASSSSAPTSSASTSSASSSSTSTSGPPSPAPAGPPAPPASGAASAATPVKAVETFYTDAAAHQYAGAWALADPALKAQLDGYTSFQAGMASDRSIHFNSARVVSQTPTAATVAVQTTSTRNTGTESCTGTVDLVSTGPAAGWQLHQVHITCR